MSRRPLRTHGRRFALGLTLMLVAGAIAVPAAFASDYTYRAFIDASYDSARAEEPLRYHNFTFTLENTSTADRNLGSANVTLPAGVVVQAADIVKGKLNKKDARVIEYRELMIKPGQQGDLVFGGTVNCGTVADSVDFGIVTKASPDFGGKGLTATLQGNPDEWKFPKELLCPPPDDFEAGQFVENGDSLIAFNYPRDAFEEVFFGDDLEEFYGPEKSAFQAACQALVDAKPNLQLALDGAFPVWSIPKKPEDYDFSGTGGNITFSMIVPLGSADKSKGAPTFAACYAGEKPIADELPFMTANFGDADIDFYGPDLLDRCAVKRPEAPCSSQSKIKEEEASQFPEELGVNAGDFLLKILYPALDPWKS
jgi:hypothetical protein